MDQDVRDIKQQLRHHLEMLLKKEKKGKRDPAFNPGDHAKNQNLSLHKLLRLYQETIKEISSDSGDLKPDELIDFTFNILENSIPDLRISDDLSAAGKPSAKKIDAYNRYPEKESPHFRKLVENALVDISVISPDGIIRFQSPAIQSILGYEPDELQGLSLFSLIHDDDSENVKSSFKSVTEEAGRETEIEYRARHKDGHYCTISSNLKYLDDFQNQPGIVFNSRDVSSRVKAYEKLKESREMLQQAQKIAKLGSWEWDIRTREMHWSGELCDIYGISPDEQPTTYSEFLEMIPMDDRKDLMELIREKYRRRDGFEFEHRLELPDGREKYFLARGQVISDENGAAVKMVGTGQDITQLKANENRLRSYSKRLRQLTEKNEEIRDKERKRIARKLHDELGQMLSVLKLDLYSMNNSSAKESAEEQIEKDSNSGHPSPDSQKQLREAIKKVDKITSSVQRISSELRPPSLDESGLADAIEEELKMFEKRTEVRSTFSNKTQSLSDLTEKESTAMFRIFQESLTNIIRHADASHVRVELSEKEEDIILKVIDNGVGLSPDKLDNSESLGILGMKERSEYLGGEIQFLNGTDGEKGTAVIVTIPRISYRNKNSENR